MRKLFLFFWLFVFHFSLCSAQNQDLDTIVCKNGKKIIGKVLTVGKTKVSYILPPDSSQMEVSTWRIDYIAYPGGTKFNFTEMQKPTTLSTSDFFLSGDFGMGVPSISYRDAIVGLHVGPRVTYYFKHHFGITAKAEVDFNGTGLDYISNNYWGGFYIFQQYLAGITYRTGGKPGFPFIDFVGLVGLCKANSPVSEAGGGINPLTVNTPGNGTGTGYYFGIDFTSSADHFISFTFGAGFLYSEFKYPDYAQTVSTYYQYTHIPENNITSKADPNMWLVLYQMYVGINFRLKKAAR